MTDDSSSAVELADRIAAICYGIVGWLAVGSGLLLALGAVRILADAGCPRERDSCQRSR